MKKAIVTLAVGHKEPYRAGILSAQKYANKLGVDYYVIDNIYINYRFPHFEKLQALELLKSGYDRVLYLDGDTLVTPNAEDIFKVYEDDTKFYAYDENSHPDLEWMNRDPDVLDVSKDIQWEKNHKGKYKYFNAGVMLFSKIHQDVFSKYREVPDLPKMWGYAEQTCLNYLIAKNNIEWQSLDYKFNRMDLGNKDLNNDRFKASIIHYAGPCLYTESGVPSKYHQIIKDYTTLYENGNK